MAVYAPRGIYSGIYRGSSTCGSYYDSDQVPLAPGHIVQYWSETKARWIQATVEDIDEEGAVRLSVKPRMWISRAEQAEKMRREPLRREKPIMDKSPPLYSPSSSPSPTPIWDRSTGTVAVERVPWESHPPLAAEAAIKQPDKSRQLFSLFSGWDVKRQQEENYDDSIGLSANGWLNRERKGELSIQEIPGAPATAADRAQVIRHEVCNQPGTQPSQKFDAADLADTCMLGNNRHFEVALLRTPQRAMQKQIPMRIWRGFYNDISEKIGCLKKLQDAERRRGDGRERSEGAEPAKAATLLVEELAMLLVKAETYLKHLVCRVRRRIKATSGIRPALETLPMEAASASSAASAERRAFLHCLGQLLTMLADIDRYRATHGVGSTDHALQSAQERYHRALDAYPQIGQAFNQLGLLAVARQNSLSAIVFGYRALLCSFAFPGSVDNLLTWLDSLAMPLPHSAACTPEGGSAGSTATSSSLGAGVTSTSDCVPRYLVQQKLQDARSCLLSAFCQLHVLLLQAKISAGKVDSATCSKLAQYIADSLQDAIVPISPVPPVGEVSAISSSEWLLEVVMIGVCATVSHARKPKSGSGDLYSYSTEPILEATIGPLLADQLVASDREVPEDQVPALEAWSALLLLGASLVKEASKSDRVGQELLLAPLALLALLCTRLAPALWSGDLAKSLRADLTELVARSELDGPSLLQYSLPEDAMIVGLLALPLDFSLNSFEGSKVLSPDCVSPPQDRPAGSDDDDSEDEVVFCQPVARDHDVFKLLCTSSPPAESLVVESPLTGTGAPIIKAKELAPEPLRSAVRSSRLWYLLSREAQRTSETAVLDQEVLVADGLETWFARVGSLLVDAPSLECAPELSDDLRPSEPWEGIHATGSSFRPPPGLERDLGFTGSPASNDHMFPISGPNVAKQIGSSIPRAPLPSGFERNRLIPELYRGGSPPKEPPPPPPRRQVQTRVEVAAQRQVAAPLNIVSEPSSPPPPPGFRSLQAVPSAASQIMQPWKMLPPSELLPPSPPPPVTGRLPALVPDAIGVPPAALAPLLVV